MNETRVKEVQFISIVFQSLKKKTFRCYFSSVMNEYYLCADMQKIKSQNEFKISEVKLKPLLCSVFRFEMFEFQVFLRVK